MYSETRISSKELHSRKNWLWTIYIMLISIKQQQPLWLKMSRISDLETDVPSQDLNCTNRHEKLRWFLIISMVFRLKSRVHWLQWKHCQKMIVSKRAKSFNIQSWWQLKKKKELKWYNYVQNKPDKKCAFSRRHVTTSKCHFTNCIQMTKASCSVHKTKMTNDRENLRTIRKFIGNITCVEHTPVYCHGKKQEIAPKSMEILLQTSHPPLFLHRYVRF